MPLHGCCTDPVSALSSTVFANNNEPLPVNGITTNQAMSDYLLSTYKGAFRESRYGNGGLFCESTD